MNQRASLGSAGRCATILLVIGATLVVGAPPVQHASAAPVNLGAVDAQMANQQGVDYGTTGNCITYSPRQSSTSSTFVTSPNAALTGHGSRGFCSGTLSTTTQSTLSFAPTGDSSVESGQLFSIGRMVHYNNPVSTNDEFFTGELNIRLTGFTGPPTLQFDWTLSETPNTGGGGCCNDQISFTNQISTQNVEQNGVTYRLVLFGFVPVDTTTPCPDTPTGTPVNDFSTVENAQTHACLYASLQEQRSLTIVKEVIGTPPTTPSFGFTTTSNLTGSPWSNRSFTLGPGGTLTDGATSGGTLTITETDPGDDRWTVTGITCTQLSATGAIEPVPGLAATITARQVVLNAIPPPSNESDTSITCTFTNTYTPQSTLTLVKQVQSGTAPPSAWTLSASGVAGTPTAGVTVSGPAGSANVTSQRVPAGSYDLREAGSGVAETGYRQVGPWDCGSAPVSGSTVTLPDAPAETTVTCTAVNELAVGSLQIAKTVSGPTGAYTGGSTKTFSGTYDCGTGFTGSFSTLTTASPVSVTGIPAGRTCTVTETAPTGDLLNASYAWISPTYTAQPVTITASQTATVTITNRIVQRLGSFAVTKQVSGPSGYTGGTSRVFPVDYTCTLDSAPTISGTLDVTLREAVSPASSIPTGSVCTFTESLTAQTGDFADASYVWGTPTVSPESITVGVATTASVTLTNPYTRQFGSLVVTKEVQGSGYLGGTAANFRVQYECAEEPAELTVADGGSVTVPNIPAGTTCTVSEVAPDASLLDPAYAWGTPVWTPGTTAVVPANGSVTVSVANPTVAVFGRIQVTKVLTGATSGVVGGTTFRVQVTCGGTVVADLAIAPGGTGETPDIPVGSTCTVSEVAPTTGLVDGSFAWGPTPAAQDVTVSTAGEIVPVSLTNTVERVYGTVQISKAAITPTGIVDASRTFDVTYSCVYGDDAAVTGEVSVQAGGTAATTSPVLVGSRCSITESADSLIDPPDPSDPSWVWLPQTVQPSDVVTVTGTTPVAVTVVNSILQRTASFSVSKIVTGSGKAGGYSGGSFEFTAVCGDATQDFSLADTDSFESDAVPAGTECTLSETSVPDVPAAYGWDPPSISVNGDTRERGASITFQIPTDATPVQINVNNPITPRFGSVAVTKSVSGLTAGLDTATPPTFGVTLACGDSGTFEVNVGPSGTATATNIPAGSSCVATESPVSGGLVDASYTWGAPTFTPADATVSVSAGATATLAVDNPIQRVTAPVNLLKRYAGPQGVVDPTFTYPVSWSCTYGGSTVASGDQDLVAGAAATQVATVPVTSSCTATEATLDAPSADPAYRWAAPTITGTTITTGGTNTVTVTNSVVRNTGRVLISKEVTGAVEGYIGTGDDFTWRGECRVADQPSIPARARGGASQRRQPGRRARQHRLGVRGLRGHPGPGAPP